MPRQHRQYPPDGPLSVKGQQLLEFVPQAILQTGRGQHSTRARPTRFLSRKTGADQLFGTVFPRSDDLAILLREFANVGIG